MQLSVVIVNYNVKYFLEQAIHAALKAAQGLEVEIFMVDNASSDGSVEMVREKFPAITLIANQDNVGFSKANNQAMRIAKGKYILLLNPDTVVEEDAFRKCIAFMDAHPEAGSLGCKMIEGSGQFLPESKRGFPSPWVAFYKTFGLSKIFPNSKKFNHYHLGYLDNDETNEIEILAGAYMFMRKAALDKVGLLDETFFMYGEDIDLSYRITQGGYKNYYFPDARIIHYKGESTKKGSLNYVKVFYNAMIIFAKKHFKGEQARFFVFMMQMAIYLRASITVFSNFFRKSYLLILDTLLIIIGLFLLKDFWAVTNFNDPNYYSPTFERFNIPLYSALWILTIYFSGGYDTKYNIQRIFRGILIGTVTIAAVYGFLDLQYRTSRMLIALGAVWTALSILTTRLIFHFFEYGNINITREKGHNYIIVGSDDESERVQRLLYKAQVWNNFVGTVSTTSTDTQHKLGNVQQLADIIQIYNISEVIFCSKDISYQSIIDWMIAIGAKVDYKIVAANSPSIVGSSSKNTQGQLYNIEVQFSINTSMNRRNKRVFDVISSLGLLIGLPIVMFLVKNPFRFIQHLFSVFLGQKTWISYTNTSYQQYKLPKLKKGILSPTDALKVQNLDQATTERVHFFYAKDYTVYNDWEILWKAIRKLG